MLLGRPQKSPQLGRGRAPQHADRAAEERRAQFLDCGRLFTLSLPFRCAKRKNDGDFLGFRPNSQQVDGAGSGGEGENERKVRRIELRFCVLGLGTAAGRGEKSRGVRESHQMGLADRWLISRAKVTSPELLKVCEKGDG